MPFAGLMLADLGADVVKLEQPPRGDPLRRIGFRNNGESVQAEAVNRDKRSVFADLRTPEGRALFFELVRDSDVLLQSARPSMIARLGIGDEVVAEVNPDLIRVYLTGFGGSGPLANAPVFDAVIQAQVGLAVRQGRGGRPETVTTYIADKVASMFVTQSVTAALLARTSSGSGDRIDLSMLDCLAYFNYPDVLEDRAFFEDAPRADERPAARSLIVQTSDGHLVLAPSSGKQVRAALEAVGRTDAAHELRGSDDASALLNHLMDLLEGATSQASTDVWLERFRAHDVPVAAVLSIEEHLNDPQVQYNGTYEVVDHPRKGRMRYARYPARFASEPTLGTLRRFAPVPGQDTAAFDHRTEPTRRDSNAST
jgi:CoA:oxalate CoA-transferase